MAKLIFIVIVTLLLVLWFKSMARRKDRDEHPPADKGGAEDMVRCQVCGVNLPRSEALMNRGRFYCCEQHRSKDSV